MFGGGIDAGEGPLEAARRELREESGLEVDEDRMTPLIHVDIFAPGREDPAYSQFVFYVAAMQPLTAGDDVDEIVTLGDADLQRMVVKMAELPETPVRQGSENTWADWGKVWGPIHAAAIERVKEMGL